MEDAEPPPPHPRGHPQLPHPPATAMDGETRYQQKALVLALSQPVHLRARQQKTADPINIAGRWLELTWLPIDRLNRTESPIRIDVAEHSLPRLLNHRQIRLAIKNLFVDPRRNPERKERRP